MRDFSQRLLGAKDNFRLKRDMSHRIGFYVPPRHQLLDLAGPLDAFYAANAATGRQLYKWSVLSRAGGLMTSGAGLPIETTPADDPALDTLLVIGGAINAMRHADEVATVRRLASHVSDILSPVPVIAGFANSISAGAGSRDAGAGSGARD